MRIKITAFKDSYENIYRIFVDTLMLEPTHDVDARYISERPLAWRGDRSIQTRQFFGVEWPLANGFAPYEIESNGRTYRVKHFKQPCP